MGRRLVKREFIQILARCDDQPKRCDYTLEKRFQILFYFERNKDCYLAERLECSIWHWDWRRYIRGGIEQQQLEELVDLLQCVSLFDKPDSWIWDFDGKDEFMVKSIRSSIDSEILPSNSTKSRLTKFVPKKSIIKDISNSNLPRKETLKLFKVDAGDVDGELEW
ncbi:hypothetical protein L1987_06526 [Smallanthus sonchifolius]|uniref:Uncharacterized protein n=1 Tax=Smallanthus sonchifolius TaxID=185202 RepID=A0ACB9JYM5_9ASTR|nr:hypothetical protein L1987_06526 [Smallanthus sonchifolius]